MIISVSQLVSINFITATHLLASKNKHNYDGHTLQLMINFPQRGFTFVLLSWSHSNEQLYTFSYDKQLSGFSTD